MCERPWGISTNFTWRYQRGLDDWSGFAGVNFVLRRQNQKMESCMERDFEIFFLGQQLFVMTERVWLSSSLPASPLLLPCQKKPGNPTNLPSVWCEHSKCSTKLSRSRNFAYWWKQQDCVYLYNLPKGQVLFEVRDECTWIEQCVVRSFHRWFSMSPTSWYSCLCVTLLLECRLELMTCF